MWFDNSHDRWTSIYWRIAKLLVVPVPVHKDNDDQRDDAGEERDGGSGVDVQGVGVGVGALVDGVGHGGILFCSL